ncbi:MAG TPA: flagellar biosynthesis protein FlhB [Chloroflexota bacterium]
MADGERSEAPTPRHLDRLRHQGNLPRSQEIPVAVSLLAGAITLRLSGPQIVDSLTNTLRTSLLHPASVSTDLDALRFQLTDLALHAALLLAPLFLVAMVVGVVSNLVQVGALFTPNAIMPQASRMSPIAGIKRLVSIMGLVEFAKSVVKLVVITAVVYQALSTQQETILTLLRTDLMSGMSWTVALAADLMMRVAVAFLFLAAADYVFQRWQFTRRSKMTKEETKEELKSTEGSPEIKRRMRQYARTLALRRMMQSVPSADVVITNPTHLAIALKYELGSRAPRVLAKGERLIAERIKELARSAGIPIVENKPLAQALYRSVDVGGEIPGAFYQVVAELLAYVYRLKGPRWRFA